VPFNVNGVGQFDIALTEKNEPRGFLQFRIAGQISEQGDLIYLGKYPPPQEMPLGMHVHAFGDTLSTHLEGEIVSEGSTVENWPEPFSIDMTITPTLSLKNTSKAEITMSTVTDQIVEIQYEIIRASNLKIDSIPPSQGDNPGPNRDFSCSFLITPQKTGKSYLGFKAFGRVRYVRHSQYIGSEIGYHLVFDDSGKLLYMGESDAFAVDFNAGLEGYSQTEKLLEYSETGYATRIERSKPDYQLDRKQEQFIQDSIRRANEADTLQPNDE
jgi:hypothetical protein